MRAVAAAAVKAVCASAPFAAVEGMRGTSPCAVLGALLLPCLAVAQNTTVFQCDFEGPLPAEITPGAAAVEGVQGYAGLGPAGRPFAGSFLRSPTGNEVRIQLSNLPPHDAVRLDFLFAAIDSLDGTGTFPSGDFLAIRIDGNLFFRESFANATPQQVQSYVSPPGVELARRVDLGFAGPGSYYTDSAYWLGADPRLLAIGHTASTLTVSMQIEGPGIQPLYDESWALDELVITTWSTAGQGSVIVQGASCGPALSVLGTPALGQNLTVWLDSLPANTLLAALAVGLSDTAFGGLPLPLPLAALGAPGCFLHNDLAIDAAMGMQLFGTVATMPIPVPTTPGLAGFTFHLQGWALAPGVNPLAIVTSNGARVVVGQ